MTNMPVIVGTIVVYMGICLVLGFVAYRRTTNLADFILGGRSLGSWVTALSAQASDMSGWLLMGLPGLAYLAGFDAVWLAAGLIVGTYLNWKFVAAPLRVRCNLPSLGTIWNGPSTRCSSRPRRSGPSRSRRKCWLGAFRAF